MKQRFFFLPLVWLLFVMVPVIAQVYDYNGIQKNAGTTYFPFLSSEYDARSAAMGGVGVGMPNGVYGMLTNPAALGFIKNTQAMLTYKPIVLDVRSGACGFAMPQEKWGTWAVSLVYLSSGEFNNLYDEYGNSIQGTLHPYAIAGNVSWSKVYMQSLAVGLTIKGIYDKVSEGIGDDIPRGSADGFGCDIGAQFRKQSSRLIYGVVVKNLGFIRSPYTEDTGKTILPTTIGAGLSYEFGNSPSVRAAFDLEKAIDNYLQYKLGLEINAYRQMLLLRGGYTFSQSDLEQFFTMIRQGTFDEGYQKTNWSLVSAGLGFKTDIKDLSVNMDAALNFRVDRLDPGFIISFLIGF